MQEDKSVFLITGDLGFGIFDKIKADFPDRFINAGAAEQAAMGAAVGLSLSGMTPIVYSITPFLLYRAAETIRNYLNYESIPVKLVGSGRDDDYKHDGYSHFAGDDKRFMLMNFENIVCRWPLTDEELSWDTNDLFAINRPFYLNLKR
jgi:transketolase